MAKFNKKHQKGWGWFCHPTKTVNIRQDAGNVPYNNSVFNSGMGISSSPAGQALGEGKKHKSTWNQEDQRIIEGLTRTYFLTLENGISPALEYLGQQKPKVKAVILEKTLELDKLGLHAQRPLAAKIPKEKVPLYELRAKVEGVNYRLIYFFDGRDIIIITHGFSKEAEVPYKEISKAQRLRDQYLGENK